MLQGEKNEIFREFFSTYLNTLDQLEGVDIKLALRQILIVLYFYQVFFIYYYQVLILSYTTKLYLKFKYLFQSLFPTNNQKHNNLLYIFVTKDFNLFIYYNQDIIKIKIYLIFFQLVFKYKLETINSKFPFNSSNLLLELYQLYLQFLYFYILAVFLIFM